MAVKVCCQSAPFHGGDDRPEIQAWTDEEDDDDFGMHSILATCSNSATWSSYTAE